MIKNLVEDEIISIQSSTNPHIIGFQHYPIKSQLKILDDAKNTKVTQQKIGEIIFTSEKTKFPICLYPSKKYLKTNRDLNEFENKEYTKQLALGEPHLKPVFFEIEVLNRYFNDPRFNFRFEDYSGGISCKYDENEKPIVREEDQIFLKSFGLGFDSDNNRLAVVYLRYLKGLTSEHQLYWKNREVSSDCKILNEYYENSIHGSWTFSHSIFTGFIGELNCLNELTKAIYGKTIFKKKFDAENRPKEFTFFFTPTLKNYYDFVSLLDKMISDNINYRFFKDKVELFEFEEIDEGVVERQRKSTLRLFEEWLLAIYKIDEQEQLKDIFQPFKKVRKERQSPAHKINENIYDKKYTNMQRELVNDSYSSMRVLRQIFQQHPKAKGIEIPEWLDNGEIKSF